MAIVLILSLFPLFGIFLVFPGLVRWSQTAWFLAELFLRIRARAVSRDNLPAATFPEPATRPKSFFQSKTYFSTAPIIVLACTCLSIDMQQKKRPEKILRFSLPGRSLHFLELVETLKVPVTEFWEIFIHANNSWDQTNWNYDRHCFEEKKPLWGSCNWEIRFGMFHFFANSWPFSGKMSLLLSNSLSFDKILLVKIEEKIAKHAIFQTLNAFLCYMGGVC